MLRSVNMPDGEGRARRSRSRLLCSVIFIKRWGVSCGRKVTARGRGSAHKCTKATVFSSLLPDLSMAWIMLNSNMRARRWWEPVSASVCGRFMEQGGKTMFTQARQVRTVAALVAGAAVVGAGVGLLYSPRPGAETRRHIGRYAKKTQVEATRLGRSVKSGVDKAIEYGKSVLPKRENGSAAEAV